MIRKGVSFQEHKIRISNADNRTSIEAQLVQIIPSVKIRQNLFILNIYSPPSSRRQCFHALISRAATLARNRPLQVVGDFNAHHTALGYNRQTVKGANLVKAAGDFALTLVSDPLFPTRIGNSVSRDTMPDLSFVRNA